MRPLDPRLLKYATTARTYVLSLVLMGSIMAGLVIGQASLLGSALAGIVTATSSTPLALHNLALLAAIIGIRSALLWLNDVLATRASIAVKSELRTAIIRKIPELGPGWLTSQRSSELAITTTRGLDALDPYFARYLPSLLLAAIVPIAITAYIVTLDVLSTIIVVVTVPLIPFFMVLIGKFTQVAIEKQWHSLQTLSGHFLDLITGLATLKAFNRSKAQLSGLTAVGEKYRTTTMGVLRISFLSSLALELISTLSVALIAVSIGLRLDNGSMQLQHGLIILILVPEVYIPLRNVGSQFHAVAEGLEASQRVFEILETSPGQTARGSLAMPNPQVIEFSDVSFAYQNESPLVLDSFSARFEVGKLHVLTGPSGAGKTTAVGILLGFLPNYFGHVRINNTELREIDPRQLRQNIAYLPQAPWLPSARIHDVLALGNTASANSMVEVLTTVGMDISNTEEFPHGLDTEISRTTGLSGGQRRRIALARTLLQDCPIVILDEPTASLDQHTENLIVELAQNLVAKGKLVIVVSHRPALIAASDTVIGLQLANGVGAL